MAFLKGLKVSIDDDFQTEEIWRNLYWFVYVSSCPKSRNAPSPRPFPFLKGFLWD